MERMKYERQGQQETLKFLRSLQDPVSAIPKVNNRKSE
jgi:hypothetical protein